jgi:hypothetical protein
VVILISNTLTPNSDEDDIQLLIVSSKDDAKKFRDFSLEMEVLLKNSQPKCKYSGERKCAFKKSICIKKCGECSNNNARVPEFESMRDAVYEYLSLNYKGKEEVKNEQNRTDEALFYEIQSMIFGKKKLELKDNDSDGDDSDDDKKDPDEESDDDSDEESYEYGDHFGHGARRKKELYHDEEADEDSEEKSDESTTRAAILQLTTKLSKK